MPFAVWMTLAKTQPVGGFDEDVQGMLTPVPEEIGMQTACNN